MFTNATDHEIRHARPSKSVWHDRNCITRCCRAIIITSYTRKDRLTFFRGIFPPATRLPTVVCCNTHTASSIPGTVYTRKFVFIRLRIFACTSIELHSSVRYTVTEHLHFRSRLVSHTPSHPLLCPTAYLPGDFTRRAIPVRKSISDDLFQNAFVAFETIFYIPEYYNHMAFNNIIIFWYTRLRRSPVQANRSFDQTSTTYLLTQLPPHKMSLYIIVYIITYMVHECIMHWVVGILYLDVYAWCTTRDIVKLLMHIA